MRRTIMLGLLLVAAACGRERRESREANDVALGNSAAKMDSSAEDTTPTPTAAPLPASLPESAAKAEAKQLAPKPAAPKPAAEPAPPPVTAEETAAASATVGKLGLTVYPAKGQTKDQTVRDELACSDWAKQQTG